VRRNPARIATFLRRALSRLAATVLITSILLPFTAPFKTYELTSSRKDQSGDQFYKDKLSDDKVVVGGDRGVAPAALTVVAATEPSAADQIIAHRILVTVLRI
jgi:hypothetical protein